MDQGDFDAQVQDYHDSPAQEGPGKFEGERTAVLLAHQITLKGFAQEEFGSVEDIGYHAHVKLDNGEDVFFVEDSQGFITELTKEQFDAASEEYERSSENDLEY